MNELLIAAICILVGIGLLIYFASLDTSRNNAPEAVDFEKEKKKFYEHMYKLDYRAWQIDECILIYKTASELRIANKKLEKAIKKLE